MEFPPAPAGGSSQEPPSYCNISSAFYSSPYSGSSLVSGTYEPAFWEPHGASPLSPASVETDSGFSNEPISEDDERSEQGEQIFPVSGGSHTHLWQFLKELLSKPAINGSAIRWVDRSKGIFKIEDSVRVARLWGRRKNRPAMNYDKLSRSIRQYYKKGIMKKTERSQRLVYQFCAPYAV